MVRKLASRDGLILISVSAILACLHYFAVSAVSVSAISDTASAIISWYMYIAQKCCATNMSTNLTSHDVLRGLCSNLSQNMRNHYDKHHFHVRFDHLMHVSKYNLLDQVHRSSRIGGQWYRQRSVSAYQCIGRNVLSAHPYNVVRGLGIIPSSLLSMIQDSAIW